jgi:hypothetical protein
MVVYLNQFLKNLNASLPEICRDSDLIKYLPNIFKNPCSITRMRARKQTPKHFYIHPHYFYLRDDVIAWLKEKYQSCESLELEEELCTQK